MTLKHPSLLMLMAGAAGFSTLAHGVTASAGSGDVPATAPAPTRLGSAIQSEMAESNRTAGERARALNLREQAVRASERRLEASVRAQQEQQEQQGAAARPGRPGPERAEAEADETIDQLARIYQAMKPKQAAIVFEQLEMEVQIAVARQMRERATAQILAAMTPAAAARLSMALAGKPPRPSRRPPAERVAG